MPGRGSKALSKQKTLGNLGSLKKGQAPKAICGLASGPEWFRERIEQGLNTASVAGFYGEGSPKILSYTPKLQHTITSAFMAFDLTAFQGKMLNHFTWLAYSMMVCLFVLALDGFDPIPQAGGGMGDMSGMGDMGGMDNNMSSMRRQMMMGSMDSSSVAREDRIGPSRRVVERLEPLFLEASKDFRSLVAYVIGGFVVRAFSMWYTRLHAHAQSSDSSS